jgi:hypothetical protein
VIYTDIIAGMDIAHLACKLAFSQLSPNRITLFNLPGVL